MNNPDLIFGSLFRAPDFPLPIIACFYTGPTAPPYTAAMQRMPEPHLGAQFNRDFPELLSQALVENPAVHDGAIMLGRRNVEEPYRVTGWSYRLFPPKAGDDVINRGSAFNSCLAMSVQSSVDNLYLISKDGIFRFVEGTVKMLT